MEVFTKDACELSLKRHSKVIYGSPVKMLPLGSINGDTHTLSAVRAWKGLGRLISVKQYSRLKQLLHIFRWLQDPDYECASPAVFSILLGHPGF